jgi:nitroimidazol reductase NimA-like FMN-containing flavoprotein (pyridoxamine 5'-phosphate oxidase superfamily)
MIGILHPDDIEDLLFRHHVGHLACVVDGAPYVVPISYVYDGGALYGQTFPGRKLSALRVRPEICFELDEQADAYTWRSVVADGVFEEVTDGTQRSAALALLAWATPVAHAGDDGVVFRLRLGAKSGRSLTTEHRH